MSEANFALDYLPTGQNGTANLTLRFDGESFTDKLTITRAVQRDRFIKAVTKRFPNAPLLDLQRELEALAAQSVAERAAGNGQGAEGSELDISHIIRAERFITPGVSGLAVATPVLREGKPASRWTLYIRWADGRREAVELTPSLELPDGRTLWVHPMPGDSGIGQVPSWAGADRKAWLDGAHAPDPADVFDRLCKCFRHYVYFTHDGADGMTATLALWTVLSYCFSAWSAVPYLFLGGPRGSGKSRTFEVLSRLAFRPLVSSNMTAAALFRTLDQRGGTLLLDEAERLKQSAPDVAEINSMLLAGYKHGGRATRCEGDDHHIREFAVYGPKALACIRGLPDALASRCICLTMFRAGKDLPQPRHRINDHPSRWRALRADLHALALEHGDDFLKLAERQDVCPAMSGRDYELWQPLLALASWVESYGADSSGADGLLKLMQDYALASTEAAAEAQTPEADQALLRALAERLKMGECPTAKDVLHHAEGEDARLFANWTAKGAANALRRYEIRTRRSHGRNSYDHVTLADLEHIERTYEMNLGLTANMDLTELEAIKGATAPDLCAPCAPEVPDTGSLP